MVMRISRRCAGTLASAAFCCGGAVLASGLGVAPGGDRRAAGLCGDATVRIAGASFLLGVNIAGGEFGNAIPGTLSQDYAYPTSASMDYYLSRGMRVFRLPFRWERVAPDGDGIFRSPDIEHLDRLVAHADQTGAALILDLHNYSRFRRAGEDMIIGEDPRMPAERLAWFWAAMAGRYRWARSAMFGLMNEPHDQDSSSLFRMLDGAIAAIREVDRSRPILVPGNHWSGAHSWLSAGNAASVASMRNIDRHCMLDVHQYLDADSSGTHAGCVEGVGGERLAAFTRWARHLGLRGFLSEFGVARNQGCLRELDALVRYMRDHADVWAGGTYWAGGPGWGEDQFTLEPADLASPSDRPQMKTLMQYLR
jgi:endoglucanase